MSTPESIKKHQDDYKDSSWREYTFEDLGKWVQLLTQRATQRTDFLKAQKDFYDAQNYIDMIQSKINEIKKDYRDKSM